MGNILQRSRFLSWLGKRPLLTYAGIVFIMTLISVTCVSLRSSPYIEVKERPIISAYHFFICGPEQPVTVENTSSLTNITWENVDSFFYISSFDRNVATMPSEAFQEISRIPENSREMQVDMTIGGTYNDLPVPSYQSHCYLITYNESGQVDSMNEQLLFDHDTRARLRSFKLKISPEAKYYKILFRVKADTGVSSSGKITLSNMDVLFR